MKLKRHYRITTAGLAGLDLRVALAAIAASAAFAPFAEGREEFRRLSAAEYRDRMAAGWLGQMAAVEWSAPTEFRWMGRIVPEDKVPRWRGDLINVFRQDDLYVEMTFLRTLEVHGLEVSSRQAGIDFANSGYTLWHANRAGRDNLRKGIAPPDSGHPAYNRHADDIDYQIEADFSGLIAPGMPGVAIALGEKFGRLINYGDGLYGGQFVGGMYAAAFFEDDPKKIVEAGLACIPAGSQYAGAIRDVLAWHEKEPGDWEATWRRINRKYHLNADYRRSSCDVRRAEGYNIDAKINGAFIAMGLLYGEGDPEKTIIISMRCGQDSDCNPANAAGVLFTTIGFKKLPEGLPWPPESERRFGIQRCSRDGTPGLTPYNFPRLCEVCEMLARKFVVAEGGRIEKDDKGQEVFVIPIRTPKPSKLEQCWEPGPIAGSTFTDAEMAGIIFMNPRADARAARIDISEAVAKFAAGWDVSDCGDAASPGLRDTWGGRENVLVTHPLSTSAGCVLTRKVDVPTGRKTTLILDVGHDPGGDWFLAVRTDGKPLTGKRIGGNTCEGGWTTVTADLSAYAGKSVTVSLENRADGWNCETGYWSGIVIRSE